LASNTDHVGADNWKALKERLTALFVRLEQIPALGDCRNVSISGPIHVSAHARLFLCRIPQRAEPFLAKCFYVSGTERADVEEARLQYEALVQLNAARGANSSFNLVQPFHLFAEDGVIAQSWIDGKSLDRAFGDAAFSIDRLTDCAAAAGAWLAHFHRFGNDGQTGIVSSTLMDEIAAETKGARLLTTAVQVLRFSVLGQGKTVQPVTTIHCDYKPANVIAATEGVCAIDFQLSTRASVYFDLAHFLNSLAIDVLKSRRLGLLFRTRQLENAFVAGYERVAGAIDPLILAYYLVYDLSRYMVQHGDAQAGLAGRGKWWAMERLLKRRLERFRAAERRGAA
jgi:hypothetical protein